MPKETGIIMSGSHPRDILDGKKSMTRRTYGLEKVNQEPDAWELCPPNVREHWFFQNKVTGDYLQIKCPYGRVGDRLWCRETWATEKRLDRFNGTELGEAGDVALWYKAGEIPSVSLERGRWRPSIFMPRWASRITLEITEVRAERLQEITLPDIVLEGVTIPSEYWSITNPKGKFYAIRQLFEDLWDSLNAKRGYGWEVNPWVWVISFNLVSQKGD